MFGFDFTVKRATFTREKKENNKDAKFKKLQGIYSNQNSHFLEPMGIEYAEVFFREWYYSWWKGLIFFPLAIWWKHKFNSARRSIKSYLAAGWKPTEEMYVQQIVIQYCGLPWNWTSDFLEAKASTYHQMKKVMKKIKKNQFEDYEIDHAKKQVRDFFENEKSKNNQKWIAKMEAKFKQYGI